MTTPHEPVAPPPVASIFMPSDFSEASEVAFAHALKLALAAGARLSIMHVAKAEAGDWQDFPGVRETLERWGLLPKGSPRSAVGALGLRVEKVLASSNDPVRACLGYLDEHPAQLIVLAVHQREGRMRWLSRPVGEPIARGAGEMTLFVPHGVKGFVAREDGAVTLRNVLVPVAVKPRPQPAVEATARLLAGLGAAAGTVTLLHVGPESEAPAPRLPADGRFVWARLAKDGDPAKTILEEANRLAADLIVMTTDGPDGFLDGLRGTTSERVLHGARCPVACLPAGSHLG